MDGYTIWLAPITGILLVDYYIVHRQQYQVSELYDPDARYRYNKYGTNWRALVAFVVSWIPLTPGFAHAVSAGHPLSCWLCLIPLFIGHEHKRSVRWCITFVLFELLVCLLHEQLNLHRTEYRLSPWTQAHCQRRGSSSIN